MNFYQVYCDKCHATLYSDTTPPPQIAPCKKCERRAVMKDAQDAAQKRYEENRKRAAQWARVKQAERDAQNKATRDALAVLLASTTPCMVFPNGVEGYRFDTDKGEVFIEVKRSGVEFIVTGMTFKGWE